VTGPALRNIAARLRDLADEVQAGFPPDPFDIRIEAIRVEAQAEMMEKEITG
jgi:hypothetical protein